MFKWFSFLVNLDSSIPSSNFRRWGFSVLPHLVKLQLYDRWIFSNFVEPMKFVSSRSSLWNWHNIIHIHNNVMWDGQYFASHSIWIMGCYAWYRRSHITLLWIWMTLWVFTYKWLTMIYVGDVGVVALDIRGGMRVSSSMECIMSQLKVRWSMDVPIALQLNLQKIVIYYEHMIQSQSGNMVCQLQGFY